MTLVTPLLVCTAGFVASILYLYAAYWATSYRCFKHGTVPAAAARDREHGRRRGGGVWVRGRGVRAEEQRGPRPEEHLARSRRMHIRYTLLCRARASLAPHTLQLACIALLWQCAVWCVKHDMQHPSLAYSTSYTCPWHPCHRRLLLRCFTRRHQVNDTRALGSRTSTCVITLPAPSPCHTPCHHSFFIVSNTWRDIAFRSVYDSTYALTRHANTPMPLLPRWSWLSYGCRGGHTLFRGCWWLWARLCRCGVRGKTGS